MGFSYENKFALLQREASIDNLFRIATTLNILFFELLFY